MEGEEGGELCEEFHQNFKELIARVVKLFQTIELQGALAHSFYEATVSLIPKSCKYTTKK